MINKVKNDAKTYKTYKTIKTTTTHARGKVKLGLVVSCFSDFS